MHISVYKKVTIYHDHLDTYYAPTREELPPSQTVKHLSIHREQVVKV